MTPAERWETTMKNGTQGVGNGAVVAPVAFLMAKGIYAEDHRVPGPNGARLGVGDRWPQATADMGMAVTIERRADGVKAFLSFRVDRLSDGEWSAFAAMPNPITLLAVPPVAWFLVEYHGGHSRAPCPLSRDTVDEKAIKALLAEPSSLAHEIVLFGIAGDEIRCVKVGLALDRVWQTLAEAAAASPSDLDTGEALDVLERCGPLDPGLMFAEAMRRHLLPCAR